MGKAVEYKKYLKGLKNAVDEVKKEKMERKGKEFIKRRKALGLSKGGGADTGRMGEMKSQMSVAMDRASRRSRDKDRLTQRDIDFIRRRSRNQDRITPGDIQGPMKKERFNQTQEQRLKNLSTKKLFGELGFSKKMNGGMMQRPMGYKSGGKTKKLKDDYFKVLGVFPTVKKKMNGGMMQRPMGYKKGGKTKKLKDDYFKVLGVFPTIKKKMGGGMMQRPMGYKSGTMVKARGCKLGRNKKTKLY